MKFSKAESTYTVYTTSTHTGAEVLSTVPTLRKARTLASRWLKDSVYLSFEQAAACIYYNDNYELWELKKSRPTITQAGLVSVDGDPLFNG